MPRRGERCEPGHQGARVHPDVRGELGGERPDNGGIGRALRLVSPRGLLAIT